MTAPSNNLPYGHANPGILRVSEDAQLEIRCQLDPILDLPPAVHSALADPIDFPSVDQAIVPGDRVVLAVDPCVPQMPEVVLCTLSYLADHGVSAEQCCVVLAGQDPRDAERLASVLKDSIFRDVVIELHDADDSSKVAYVAANKQGDPIYMNRSVVDADVVLPIMCSRGKNAIDYEGAYGVFPLLSDRRTRGQFYSLRQLSDPSEHERLQAWANEAAWWVGVLVAVQVVPGPDNRALRIVAGEPQALEQTVQLIMKEAWSTDTSGVYDAVVALIDGDRTQQTWDSVARVLAQVSPLVAPEGIVVICSELADKPGRSLRKLANANRSEDAIAKELSHDSSNDAFAAAVILDAREEYHVYLLSQLSRDAVESLGLGAIQNLGEAEHALMDRGRTLVLGSAQHRCSLLACPKVAVHPTSDNR